MRKEFDSKPLRREYVLEYRRRGSAWSVRKSARISLRHTLSCEGSALPSRIEKPVTSDALDTLESHLKVPAQSTAESSCESAPTSSLMDDPPVVPEAQAVVHAALSPVQPTLAVPTTAAVIGPVLISYVHFLGSIKRSQSDEFIEIVNIGDSDVDVSSWRIEAGASHQFFIFPEKTILSARGKVQVYTNTHSEEPGVFSFGSKRALWNDHGDLGRLFDAKGHEVSRYGYGDSELRTIESILYAHRIPSLNVLAPLAIQQEQVGYRGKIDFFTALERAVRCLVDEPWPQEAQPDVDVGTRLTEGGLPAINRARLARSALRLLSLAELPGPEQALLQMAWVFVLMSAGGTSSASHQVVIDRAGKKPAFQQVG